MISMILRNFRDRSGWTLMELMIVVAIIGIISAFAIPGYLSGMPLRRLKADAMDLASNLKYAKMKAVQRNVQVGLYFDNSVDPNVYLVYEDSDNNNQFDSTLDSQIKENIALRNGVQFDNGSWTITNNTIVFRSNGSASKSGTVIISNGSDTRNIVVHAITGRVRIE